MNSTYFLWQPNESHATACPNQAPSSTHAPGANALLDRCMVIAAPHRCPVGIQNAAVGLAEDMPEIGIPGKH